MRPRAVLCLLAAVAGAVTGLGLAGVPPVGLLAFENPPAPDGGAGLRADAAAAGPTRIPAPLVVGPTRLMLATGAGPASGGPIPAVALEAYQRAAAVLAEARPRCGLEWPLLAAIGKVGSDHGTAGTAALRADGVSVPALVGPPLDGRHRRATVRDSDGGRLDGDRRWDRAVGPLQVLPSTWTVVGVDGDGDGVRAPDDIDDAALAVGVALCSGHTGLDTAAGMRTALLGYNASVAYADRVLAVERLYRSAGLPETSASPTFAATPVVLRATRARITHLARHPGTLVPVPAPGPAPRARAELAPSGGSPHATVGGSTRVAAIPEPSSPEPTGSEPSSPEPTSSESSSPGPGSPAAGTPGTDPCAADACPAGTPAAEEPATPAACPEPADPASTETPSTEPPPTEPPPTEPSPSAEPSPSPTDDPCADPALAGSATPEEPAPTAVVSPSTPAAP